MTLCKAILSVLWEDREHMTLSDVSTIMDRDGSKRFKALLPCMNYFFSKLVVILGWISEKCGSGICQVRWCLFSYINGYSHTASSRHTALMLSKSTTWDMTWAFHIFLWAIPCKNHPHYEKTESDFCNRITIKFFIKMYIFEYRITLV